MNELTRRMLGLVTDRLCGQLTVADAVELKAYLRDHPDFSCEIERLEATWRALGGLDCAPLSASDREALAGRIAGRLEDANRLADEELDLLAAAGQQVPTQNQ